MNNDEYMTDERVEELAQAIDCQTRDFREWVAAGYGWRDGFYTVCPCCGNPYLYLDVDFADPCPICLAPAAALGAICTWVEIAAPENDHPAISLEDARRNVVRYEQVYPPGHPRHMPEAPPGATFDMEFVCLTAELRPEEWNLSSIAEDYFQEVKAALTTSCAGFWRIGGERCPERTWRAWDDPRPRPTGRKSG
jgi:hypothetical protein